MYIDILTALAVLVSVSLLLGILLSLFIRWFGVEEDEKKKKIRDALPGVNCGACGFKGCNDYAEALFKGTAKPNLCIPGAEATAKELGVILGVSVEAPEDMVAFVHCNGTCDATSPRAKYDGVVSCKGSSMFYGGPLSCSYGCLGCGDCAAVCSVQAICVSNGVARVDTSRCVGCGLCVRECPKKIISMIPHEAAIVIYCSSKAKGVDARKACQNACIGCKKCEKACQNRAISVTNNCAAIDYTRCTGCGLCVQGCPTGCLKSVADTPEDCATT